MGELREVWVYVRWVRGRARWWVGEVYAWVTARRANLVIAIIFVFTLMQAAGLFSLGLGWVTGLKGKYVDACIEAATQRVEVARLRVDSIKLRNTTAQLTTALCEIADTTLLDVLPTPTPTFNVKLPTLQAHRSADSAKKLKPMAVAKVATPNKSSDNGKKPSKATRNRKPALGKEQMGDEVLWTDEDNVLQSGTLIGLSDGQVMRDGNSVSIRKVTVRSNEGATYEITQECVSRDGKSPNWGYIYLMNTTVEQTGEVPE